MTRCKHQRARAIVCMVPDGINEKPIQHFSTGGYTVLWCPDCGALRARNPKRYALLTSVQWRRPREAVERDSKGRRVAGRLDELIAMGGLKGDR